MRKHLVTFLILLMTALPVWSVAMVCHHVQTQPQMATVIDAPSAESHCHLDVQKQQPQQTGQICADACYCDQLQHAQFMLSLPVLPTELPTHRFIPPMFSLQVLPEPIDLLYRPPIA